MNIQVPVGEWVPVELTGSELFNVRSAEGWLGLGNWREALAELDQIAPENQINPFALGLRYQCMAAAGNWEEAIALARVMQQLLPGSIWGGYHMAQALHKSGRTLEAYGTMREMIDTFPGEWVIYFALTRYCCGLGRTGEALRWFDQALDLADKNDLKRLAMVDPDLQPIRGEIVGMEEHQNTNDE
jgi:tetratricopeptide (TPR) repeat protein